MAPQHSQVAFTVNATECPPEMFQDYCKICIYHVTHTLSGFGAKTGGGTTLWTPEEGSYYVRSRYYGLTAGVPVTSVRVREELGPRTVTGKRMPPIQFGGCKSNYAKGVGPKPRTAEGHRRRGNTKYPDHGEGTD